MNKLTNYPYNIDQLRRDALQRLAVLSIDELQSLISGYEQELADIDLTDKDGAKLSAERLDGNIHAWEFAVATSILADKQSKK